MAIFETELISDPETAGTEHPPEKWLELAGDPGARWRLPDDTNLDFVEARIKSAMGTGEALMIEVVDGDPATSTRLILSGKALPFAVLRESPCEG